MRYLILFLTLLASLTHGAINEETPRATYTGNGATTDFAFAPTFTLSDPAHLKVYLDDVLQESGYTQDADSVTFSTAPASGVEVKLERDTPVDQPTTTANLRLFSLNAISAALDRAARIAQEHKQEIDDNFARSLRVPDGETLTQLSAAAARKGLVLYFNSSTGDLDLKTPDELIGLTSGLPDGIGVPAGGTTGQLLGKTSDDNFALDWIDAGVTQSAWEAAITDAADARTAIGVQRFANIVDFGAVAGTGVSAGVRTANTAAIQAAIDTGFNVYLPPGRFEIDADLVKDTTRQDIIGAGEGISIIYQATAAENGITIIDDPAIGATGVTKVGNLRGFSIQGVGAGTSTGVGLSANKVKGGGHPSNAHLVGERLYIAGFSKGLVLASYDNCSFFRCEFNSNATNVYTGSTLTTGGFTNTVSFRHCNNASSTGISWHFDVGSSVLLDSCDTGSGSQHVLFNGNKLTLLGGNFEAVNGTGSPNGFIETTSGALHAVSPTVAGGNSTLPAFYIGGTSYNIVSPTISGFGAGGGKVRKATASVTGSVIGDPGVNSGRSALQTFVAQDNAGQFELPAWGAIDAVRYDAGNPTSAVRGLMQYRAGTGAVADDIRVNIYNGSSYENASILNRELLTTSASTGAVSMVRNTRYKATGASPQTYTLPTTANVDDEVEVIAYGAGGVTIAQNSGQAIRIGSSVTTSGTSHGLTLAQGDVVRLKCTAANTIFIVVGGNFNATTF